MNQLFVDDRYRGAHGIGRYAGEVLSRLRLPWTPLGLDGSPSSPLDSFRPVRNASGNALVYSPGYGALLRAPRQLLTLHDLIQLRASGLSRWKFEAYYAGPVRRTVRKTGVVLTVSETSAREIRRWLNDDAVQIVNAGNGCSAAFHPHGHVEAADDPYVLYVGNARAHKNLDVLLQALISAPDVHLRAVVPAAEVAELAARAEGLGIGSRVQWMHGLHDEQLAALYRGAAATAMPSTLEGFGLPALESVCCGVPVLYWRGCEAVAEIVGDRGWGLGSAHDPQEWATALTSAVAARRRVEPPTGYDWDRTASIVSETLEQLIS
ncbi:glycosyltransferase family 4 protein [Microbacterium sp. A82]|uniref:glycosyltransferase family 4 protein n=1 Tax=Microbacterium sp. A82 TaxID=3450452 RepID=UPI003F3705A0